MFSEIERKAWESRTGSDKHKPEMVCKAVLDQMERGALGKVKHIIVVVVENYGEDNSDLIHLMQAGELSELASEGALNRAIALSREQYLG